MKPIIYKEHMPFPDCYDQPKDQVCMLLADNSISLKGTTEFMAAPTYLGLDAGLTASYFIGADWLIENRLPVIVLPKLDRLDFAKMLLTALCVEDGADYFSQCYGLTIDKPAIETDAVASYLTPILLVHYISLLERLCRMNLRKDYITLSDNLNGKIKGHLLVNRQLQKNIKYHALISVICGIFANFAAA